MGTIYEKIPTIQSELKRKYPSYRSCGWCIYQTAQPGPLSPSKYWHTGTAIQTEKDMAERLLLIRLYLLEANHMRPRRLFPWEPILAVLVFTAYLIIFIYLWNLENQTL